MISTQFESGLPGRTWRVEKEIQEMSQIGGLDDELH